MVMPFWSILILVLLVAGVLMIAYGIYGTIFVRKWFVNAWVVRGIIVILPALYLYFNYKYTGKIYLTKYLPVIMTGVVLASLVLAVYLGWSERIRLEFDAQKNQKNRVEYDKAYRKHFNKWKDLNFIFNFIRDRLPSHSNGSAHKKKDKKSKSKKHKGFGKNKKEVTESVEIDVATPKDKGKTPVDPSNTVGVAHQNQNPRVSQSLNKPMDQRDVPVQVTQRKSQRLVNPQQGKPRQTQTLQRPKGTSTNLPVNKPNQGTVHKVNPGQMPGPHNSASKANVPKIYKKSGD